MKVTVQIVGVLTKPEGKDLWELDLPEGAKIADIFPKLGYNRTQANYITSAVDGKEQKKSFKLKEGDTVMISMIVGGG